MARIEVRSDITGNVWKVLVEAGQSVEEEQPLLILESMKMEIPVNAPEKAVVREVCVEEERPVVEGEVVIVLEA